MEIVRTTHPLRTIILRYDRQVTAQAFEIVALAHYREIHDRAWEVKQRVAKGRRLIPGFNFQIEELETMFKEAQRKFEHLKIMFPTNPDKEVVREQLISLSKAMSELMDDFVTPMIDEVNIFFAYDDYIFEQEEWMSTVAFPQFDKIFKRYTECSVDLAYFDRDLEDFRYAWSRVKDEEGKYIAEMNELVDRYSDLNYEIGILFEKVEEFDGTLSPFF